MRFHCISRALLRQGSFMSSICFCQGSPHKKKKRKTSGVGRLVQGLELIALGTTSGSLLLYSVNKGELHSELVMWPVVALSAMDHFLMAWLLFQNGGHTSRVTCVCWSSDGERLFSCSEDQHIIEWSVASAAVKQ